MNFVQLLAEETTTTDIVGEAWDTYIGIINIIMPVLISVVVSFGLIYGIILGVQFAKAEDTEARDKAKERLINVVIGVVVTAVILAICYVILGSSWIKGLFKNKNITNPAGDAFLPFLK